MGVEQLWWDGKKRKYVTREEQMVEVAKGKDLTDIGTRWQHLIDLRETWQNALVVFERVQPGYRTKQDITMQENLTVAIALLDKQLDVLSRYETKSFKLRRVVDAIPKNVSEQGPVLPQ